jgi:tetratricopeptide (TPR) repeat protein
MKGIGATCAFAGATLLLSCASTLTLKSNPAGADVHALGEKGDRAQLLGQTPLQLPMESTRGLEITKPGFLSTYVFLPKPGSGQDTALTVNLQNVSRALVESLVKEKHPGLLDDAAYDLLELQAAATAGRETEVTGLVRKFETRYGKFVTFNLILGNFYFGRKDYRKSREHYDRALELDPENKDARQMLKLLSSSRR